MTGFIRGLFGGNDKKSEPAEQPQPTIESAGGSYFLDPDDAKTYGNIDFMRTSKTVRRTFAKKRGETEEKESVKKISSLEMVSMEEGNLPKPKTIPTETSFQSTSPTPNLSRRQVDTNIDMFRKMAKDIKK